MVINLIGSTGIRCQVADFVLIVDPPSKRKANITLLTEVSLEGSVEGEEGFIYGPGEYEIEGVRIKGIALPASDKKNLATGYSVFFDDIKLGFIKNLEKIPSQEDLEKLGEIDILFVNTENSSLNFKEINSFIKKVEPNIIIPLTDKGAKNLMEEIGQKVTQEEKLTLKAKDINEEEGVKIVWLKEI
ncbi:MAG: hypothetical protein COT88_01675 [Candidatus Colwellbacteria bacterium CG10_big_fil_rev_8_21_14_0_10_41_28]|uniref:Uncharacterized protein n=1 Tax=Candidatus Colwellbacteria bacterium CG10_big_fil_rev_8_21_14_0_10_41_28 TaxID=1974539 RepID=A0A2H0VJC9_9BACT|nr:MAG: hypothetical protein COT88_01675 [Candidatus Colwellbacteria bacterium CG10_big_fil_rev_8_21_14_0_10_41_28]